MTAASVAANAYVVGPRISERMRVQAISCTSAANPDAPRMVMASQGGACECAFCLGRWLPRCLPFDDRLLLIRAEQ